MVGDHLVTTGWSPEYSDGQMGWILARGYRYRVRHEIALVGSTVGVRSTVERRAPGGPRSRRWERVDGRRAAEALLADIEKHLEVAP